MCGVSLHEISPSEVVDRFVPFLIRKDLLLAVLRILNGIVLDLLNLKVRVFLFQFKTRSGFVNAPSTSNHLFL